MPDQQAGSSEASKRPSTIHEVARLAGVSHQTVTRYLREDPGMRPQTATKVARAIEELDYRPNLAARSMRTRRSNRIAVVLPDSTSFVPTRPLSGAAAAAHEAGYLLDVVGLQGDAATRAARIADLLQPGTVEGILSFTPLEEGIGKFIPSTSRVPIVVEGQYDDNMRARERLADASLVADIIEYLAELGHRRFVHVAGSDLWASARNRRAVYEATVAELGLESCAVVEGDWSVKSGWDAAREVVAGSGATAVFAANDHVGFGVIRGLQSLGIEVPGQVSVFGWDDAEIGRYLDPPLSTVRVDQERLGWEAMNRLLTRLRGEPTPVPLNPQEVTQLVVRESTGLSPSSPPRD